MHFTQLLTTALTSGLASASFQYGHGIHGLRQRVPDEDQLCGSIKPSSKLLNSLTDLKDGDAEFSISEATGEYPTDTIKIPVHMHAAIAANSSSTHVSEEKMREQFEVLKKEYAAYDIELRLEEVTRELNSSLSTFSFEEDEDGLLGGSTPEIEDFWKRTRTGDYETLHVYVYDEMPGLNGICNFPLPDRGPDEFYLDACHILAATLPGSNVPATDQGLVAVHEVGHWFGLFHVFQGGCDPDGDMVDDTPAQDSYNRNQNNTCIPEDSCPGLPGTDSINNFMSYSGDHCWEEFTPGQRARMHNMFRSLRAGN